MLRIALVFKRKISFIVIVMLHKTILGSDHRKTKVIPPFTIRLNNQNRGTDKTSDTFFCSYFCLFSNYKTRSRVLSIIILLCVCTCTTITKKNKNFIQHSCKKKKKIKKLVVIAQK